MFKKKDNDSKVTEFKKISLQALVDKWPSPYVAREEIERFSGGILTAKYMANLDSAKKGPSGRFYVGRKSVYPVGPLVRWMEERSSTIV